MKKKGKKVYLNRRGENSEEKIKIEPTHNEHGLYQSVVGIVVAKNNKVRK